MKATRGSALSAARSTVALAWFAMVMTVALAIDHPLGLVSLAAALVLVGWLAGAGRQMAKAMMFAVPLAITVMLVNALVERDGLTVVARLGEYPVVGRLDLTAEALAQSATLALRVIVIALAVSLFAACVDQDDVTDLLRRRSGRLGIVMALAARMVPLLAADGRRMVDARNATPTVEAASRMALFGAVAGGALDRAADAAATLELRGLGDGPCLAPRRRRAWSRHDRALVLSAVTLGAVSATALIAGWLSARFTPGIELASKPGTWVFVLVVPAIAALPLLDRRGVGR